MGIHTGEPMIGDEGYLGIDVVRGARLCAAAHGGQVVLSETTRALVAAEGIEGVGLLDLGEHRFKGLRHPERVYQLVIAGLQTEGSRSSPLVMVAIVALACATLVVVYLLAS